MGLDMYLHKRTYVKNWDHNPNKYIISVTRTTGGTAINPSRINEVEEEVAYWRKENHIHNWFVENVQDGNDECQDSYVSLDQIRALVDVCKEVIANPETGPEKLPTKEGFFFGSTEYDESYLNGCRETIKMLEPLLVEGENEGSYYYSASW